MRIRTIIGIALTLIILLLVATAIYFKWEAFKEMKLNEYGDTFAGVAASLALVWIVVGYSQQGEELRHNTEALRRQEAELKTQATHLAGMVEQATVQATALQASVQAMEAATLQQGQQYAEERMQRFMDRGSGR